MGGGLQTPKQFWENQKKLHCFNISSAPFQADRYGIIVITCKGGANILVLTVHSSKNPLKIYEKIAYDSKGQQYIEGA